MYIGIDLGTSAMKGIVVDKTGVVLREASASYEIICPQNGWTEQMPEDWLHAMHSVLKELCEGDIGEKIKGISFSGQMHGLVAVDEFGQVIRPCILWNDGRADGETDYLNSIIEKDNLVKLTGNIAFAGFTAPKLMWLRTNEPKNFNRISKIMLPKDYLAYTLTGIYATDFSDASGTLLLDVKNKRWSRRMLNICGLSEKQLPQLHESYDCIGVIKSEIATRYGMRDDVKVIIGAGDNASAAIGMGAVRDGDCNISLGTSGTVFVCRDQYRESTSYAMHNFAHANGKWHLMGCILSAASCRKWWIENVLLSNEYDGDECLASKSECGKVLFLPYLRGERCPHNDVYARGAFIGLSADTTRGQMSRAIMEGVAFAIRDCLDSSKGSGDYPSVATICGGGAKSVLWKQIMADVLNIPIRVTHIDQGPAFGASILAMVGCGEYSCVTDAVDAIGTTFDEIKPDKNSVIEYEIAYQKYKKLYPALKDIF